MLGSPNKKMEMFCRCLEMIRTHWSWQPGSGPGEVFRTRLRRWSVAVQRGSNGQTTNKRLVSKVITKARGERGNYERMQALWKHADAMRMMLWDEMHDMNKMQNKRQKPNHEGNNISHIRKWQELELQIWNVISGALHSVYVLLWPECRQVNRDVWNEYS